MIRSDQLVAAIGVFARYGFRKTSMDDVAAAMGMSRQALYKKFSFKKRAVSEPRRGADNRIENKRPKRAA